MAQNRVRKVIAAVNEPLHAWATEVDWQPDPSGTWTDGRRWTRRQPVVFDSTDMLVAMLNRLKTHSPDEAISVMTPDEPQAFTEPWGPVAQGISRFSPRSRSALSIRGTAVLDAGKPTPWTIEISSDRTSAFPRVSVSGVDSAAHSLADSLELIIDDCTVVRPKLAAFAPVVEPASLEQVRREMFESEQYRKARRAGMWAGVVSGLGATLVAELLIQAFVR